MLESQSKLGSNRREVRLITFIFVSSRREWRHLFHGIGWGLPSASIGGKSEQIRTGWQRSPKKSQKRITEKKWFHEINVVILVFEDAKTSFWILVNLYKGKEVSNVDSEKCQEWPQGFLLCQHWSVEFPNSLSSFTLLNTRMRSQETKDSPTPEKGCIL